MADNTTPTTEGGLTAIQGGTPMTVSGGGKGTLVNVAPPKGILLNAGDTSGILENMQKLADQINNPYRQFQESLKDMQAWTQYDKTPALVAREEARAADRANLYNIAQQQAALKASQTQGLSDLARINALKKQGAGEGELPSYILEALAAVNPNDVATQQAILNNYYKTQTTEKIKGENNPASLDVKPVLVWNPITKQAEMQNLNMFQYNEMKKKGLIREASSYYEQETPKTDKEVKPVSVAPGETPINKAVFSTETSSGANVKPSVQGALGPMQITPDTWATNVKRGVIPANYDINNPVQNKEAGDRILAYYETKYKGDPDKVLAAYHGGEGAINPDGSINLERKDKLGTSIGDYIAMNKAKMEIGPQAFGEGVQLAANKGMPDIGRMIAEQKIKEEEASAAAKERGKSIEEKRSAFENDIAPTSIIEDKETNKRIQGLVSANPEITGVLSGAGYGKAIAGQLERGIGNITVNDLSTAILQTLPKTTNLTMAQRNELATYLARMELKAAKLIKGQGQITEGERDILKHASSSIKDPAEAVYKKAKMLERIADLNDELSKIYGDGSQFSNFRTFNTDPRVVEIHRRYQKDLNNILNEEVNFARKAPSSGAPKTQHPADILDIIKRNQAPK